jgi:flavin reductase (DIM6/NTAB) family NADH-FMN oxidoreductase RutF
VGPPAGSLRTVTNPLDPHDYRRVVGRFATGVTVISTVRDGEHHAMTCNSFTSVSLEPVLVLFCAEKIARFHDAVLASGTWAVSVLGEGQEELSRHFAARGREVPWQFAGVPHGYGPHTGAAVLDGALAVLECRTVTTTEAGDHTVVIGEVLGLDVPEPHEDPLLYYEGRYRVFHPAADSDPDSGGPAPPATATVDLTP